MIAKPLIEQRIALGIIIGAGLLMVLFPELIAMTNETIDAIGSKRTDIESTRWRL